MNSQIHIEWLSGQDTLLVWIFFFNLNKHTLFWVVKELSPAHELFDQDKDLTIDAP